MPPHHQINLFNEETDEQGVAALLDSPEGWLAQLILSHRELKKNFRLMDGKLDVVIKSNITRESLLELRQEFNAYREKTEKVIAEKMEIRIRSLEDFRLKQTAIFACVMILIELVGYLLGKKG